jgi:transposase
MVVPPNIEGITVLVFAGVDCHKGSHTIVFIDQTGRELQSLTITNEERGFAECLATAEKRGDVLWGLEGASSYGRQFSDFLVARGAQVYDVPGHVAKRHRRQSTRRGKTDAIDAKAIAEALIRDWDRIPRYYHSEMQLAMRLRYDQRDRLVRQQTVEVNRLKAAAAMMALPIETTARRVRISLRFASRLAICKERAQRWTLMSAKF